MRTDERNEGTRNPNIDFKGFIYKNYKDLIAAIFVILCLLILVFKDDLSKEACTLLIMVVSASLGFIFGKKVS